MIVGLGRLARILYNLLGNKPNEVFFMKESGKGVASSVVGDFHIYAYSVPEQGLRIEDFGAIRAVFSRVFKDRLSCHFVWVIQKNRLIYLLLFLPASNIQPPPYIQEYGFEKISADRFNEIIREVFGIESTAMYLPI